MKKWLNVLRKTEKFLKYVYKKLHFIVLLTLRVLL